MEIPTPVAALTCSIGVGNPSGPGPSVNTCADGTYGIPVAIAHEDATSDSVQTLSPSSWVAGMETEVASNGDIALIGKIHVPEASIEHQSPSALQIDRFLIRCLLVFGASLTFARMSGTPITV